jgi:hypothetical protein
MDRAMRIIEDIHMRAVLPPPPPPVPSEPPSAEDERVIDALFDVILAPDVVGCFQRPPTIGLAAVAPQPQRKRARRGNESAIKDGATGTDGDDGDSDYRPESAKAAAHKTRRAARQSATARSRKAKETGEAKTAGNNKRRRTIKHKRTKKRRTGDDDDDEGDAAVQQRGPSPLAYAMPRDRVLRPGAGVAGSPHQVASPVSSPLLPDPSAVSSVLSALGPSAMQAMMSRPPRAAPYPSPALAGALSTPPDRVDASRPDVKAALAALWRCAAPPDAPMPDDPALLAQAFARLDPKAAALQRPNDPLAVRSFGWVGVMGNAGPRQTGAVSSAVWAGTTWPLAQVGMGLVAPPSGSPDGPEDPDARALRVLVGEAHMPWFVARVRSTVDRTLGQGLYGGPRSLFDVLPLDAYLVVQRDARGDARPYDIYVVLRLDSLLDSSCPAHSP